jgi:hypothetical protein
VSAKEKEQVIVAIVEQGGSVSVALVKAYDKEIGA